MAKNSTKQIKIKIKKEHFDIFLELIGILFVIILIFLSINYYSQLPEEIPIHLNFKGEIDGYGPKYILLIFSLIGIIIYSGLFVLSKYPHKFKYLVKITEKNAEKQYLKSTRLIRKMNVIIVAMILFIVYEIIQISLTGKPFRLAPMIYLFLFLLLIIIGFYIISSLKEK